jgi:hypothetical protein
MELTHRGLLRVGGWSEDTLNIMSSDDKRNTVIELLSEYSSQPVGYYQGLDDHKLIDRGAILILLRNLINDDTLKQFSDDEQRNSIISAIHNRTDTPVGELQGKSNRELVEIGLRLISGSKIVSAILKIDWNIDTAKVLKTAPYIIITKTLDNSKNNVEAKKTFTYSEKVTNSYKMTLTGEYKIGGEVSIEGKAGIPVLAEGSAGVKINSSLTLSAAFEADVITETEYSNTTEVTLKPKTMIKMSASVTRGKMNVPYRALIRTSNGEEKWTEGMWEGTSTVDCVEKSELIDVKEEELVSA